MSFESWNAREFRRIPYSRHGRLSDRRHSRTHLAIRVSIFLPEIFDDGNSLLGGIVHDGFSSISACAHPHWRAW